MRSNSTTSQQSDKPAKPYPDFPLFPHATKRWAKKIRGKMHYFGPWDDPDAALNKYLEQKDDLFAGRKPRQEADGITVKDVANAFLIHKAAMRDGGELSPLTWRDYKETCDLLIRELGKKRLVSDLAADDFAAIRKKMTKRWGLHRIAKNIQYTRSVFKHALDSGLIERPVQFGPGFSRPSKKNFRIEKARKGVKLFSREELRAMLKDAAHPLKAMILLGINAGFGNADCGNLPLSALDLDNGVIDYPRPKTGLPRRATLWPETIDALREWLSQRSKPANPTDAGLVFLTVRGASWAKKTSDNPVSKETRKLFGRLGIGGERNFYALRHTFRTVADEARDQPACDYIMGHEIPHMSTVYRETISDERLRAVTDHVRAWLFVGEKDNGDAGKSLHG